MGQRIYGLIGRTLGHSYSVPIHRELGNDRYALYPLEPEALGAFLAREDIAGLNVTIPYKRDVIPFCGELDETAREIGSVNTIVRGKNGVLKGYNTDAYGLLYLARRAGISFSGQKVVVFGGGGASLTARYVAVKGGAREIVVISRGGENNYENLNRHANAEILINATPVGMVPDTGRLPADPALFPECVGVLDLVYNPRRTALLFRAEELGIPCANGLPMLVAQAKAAEELFFGRAISDREIERVLAKLDRDSQNIVLIGMPGSGKSTVGAALSRLSGREVIDLDEQIVRAAGRTIPEIFAERGEAAFRALEREQARLWGRESGKILVTGGGIVKDERNDYLLRQNGRVYQIERDVSLLERDGRPLSANADLTAMQRERAPLYERFRDATVTNTASAEETARKIWEDYHAYFGAERAESEPAGTARTGNLRKTDI
ncbi:MAG: shikimate kinase [Eubacteriales bacterium]|nr:shikimate kinase [Eubacteriales bacterium]